MSSRTLTPSTLRLGLALLMSTLLPASGGAANRSLEFETNEVTTPGISVSADGRSIVFNLVGHLFRLPVTGGPATQLTFGPYYDSEPVLSPDGTRIAFISNRDGSDGNIFVMDLTGGKITQVTNEFRATVPAWSPDSRTIAYSATPAFGATTVLSTIPVQGGTPRRFGTPRVYSSILYLADGRVAVIVGAPGGGRGRGAGAPGAGRGLPPQPAAPVSTTVEVLGADGAFSAFATIPSAVTRPIVNQARNGLLFVSGDSLREHIFGEAEPRVVAPIAGGGRFDIARDRQAAYVAAESKLFRVSLPIGTREPITWNARVKMETLTPAVNTWAPSSAPTVGVRSIMTPRLSPDGRTLVFMAGGILWEQPTTGTAPAKKVLDETAYQLEPAFSPDGTQLAFVSDKWGTRELRVIDRTTRQTRTLETVAGASWVLFPAWSADGKTVVFQRSDRLRAPYQFMRADAQTGKPVKLGQSTGDWTARPHLSSDGSTLYYTARTGNNVQANLFRIALTDGAAAQPVTGLTRHAHDAKVSPDGKWVAFRRNYEIMIAPMGSAVLKDADFQRFSARGGRSFDFTADSSAIVYSEGAHVWRQPVQGRAVEIPVRLTMPRAAPPPVLISRVRVLDLKAGRFSEPTSMLVERGRISWIGAEAGRTIPPNAVRIDGNNRFAIPGIHDSHTHAAWTNQQITEDSLIAYGVTSVRDTGSRLDVVNMLLDRGDATSLPIPRYFGAGDIFEGPNPTWGDAFLEIGSKEEAREYARRWKDLGAAFVKVYGSLPWAYKTEAATEANRLGLPVAGHGLSLEENVRSINLGLTSLEHNGANNGDDIIKLFAASGVRLDPTLTVLNPGTPLVLADPATLDERFRTFIPEDEIRAARPGREVSDADKANWENNTLAAIKKKFDMGVKLLDGTDALMTSTFHGPSVHWSLQFFAQAGVPAIDVLRMATIQAAETVGAGADLGSLEQGKIADVVLLDADPLQSVKNTLTVWRVLKGGHVFDPATMRKQ